MSTSAKFHKFFFILSTVCSHIATGTPISNKELDWFVTSWWLANGRFTEWLWLHTVYQPPQQVYSAKLLDEIDADDEEEMDADAEESLDTQEQNRKKKGKSRVSNRKSNNNDPPKTKLRRVRLTPDVIDQIVNVHEEHVSDSDDPEFVIPKKFRTPVSEIQMIRAANHAEVKEREKILQKQIEVARLNKFKATAKSKATVPEEDDENNREQDLVSLTVEKKITDIEAMHPFFLRRLKKNYLKDTPYGTYPEFMGIFFMLHPSVFSRIMYSFPSTSTGFPPTGTSFPAIGTGFPGM